MDTYSIYRITNTVTGRVYVGRTIDPVIRFAQHRTKLRAGKHHMHDMQQDFDTTGAGTFAYEVVHVTRDWAESGRLEQQLIRDEVDPYNRLHNPNYIHHASVRAQQKSRGERP